MSQLFVDGELNRDAFAAEVRPLLTELIGVRIDTRSPTFGAPHLLLAISRLQPKEFESLLAPHMLRSANPQILTTLLREDYRDAYPDGQGPRPLLEADMSPEALALLGELSRELPASGTPRGLAPTLRVVLPAIFRHLTDYESSLMSFCIEPDAVAQGIDAEAESVELEKIALFDSLGELRPDAVTADASQLLEEALRLTALTGHTSCQQSHLALACIEVGSPRLLRHLRLYGNGSQLTRACEALSAGLRRPRRTERLPLAESSFSLACRRALANVPGRAGRANSTAIFIALMRHLHLDPGAERQLIEGPLHLRRDELIAALEQSLADEPDEVRQLVSRLPGSLSACENLGDTLRSVPAERYVERPQSKVLLRALHSQDRSCVIVHGEPGVGVSALVEGLVRGARDVPFLESTVFARIDLALLDEKTRGSFLRSLANHAGELSGHVVVLENLDRALAENVEPVRRLAGESGGLTVIACMTTDGFNRFVAPDPELGPRVSACEVPEPDRATTLAVARAVVDEQIERFGVPIERDDLEAIARMADDFLSARRRPGRTVELIRLACAEAAFLRDSDEDKEACVDRDIAARALARRTGYDLDRIVGERSAEYYERELDKCVFGQPEAVELVSEAIHMARAGARLGDRPAGNYLFLGQTGTGKTLLAKEVAKLFSPSGTLHTFSMADFKESHSVSRLLGAPPGYKGYDEGGNLVEKLLADPQAVLLFDESDKAHPEVLDVLLQLCDEGWVEDSMRRIARAREAMVILTSNLCQDVIDRGLKLGLSTEAITDEAQDALRKARRPDTGTLYFRPEFLGRMDATVIFRPLSRKAMALIAEREIELSVEAHRDQRALRLIPVTADWKPLAQHLSTMCAGDPKHGRAISHLLRRLVAGPLAGYVPAPGTSDVVRIAPVPGGVALETSDGTRLGRGGAR